ncbi:MAG: Gfo/Idh/MocA family oxidoreductase [Anaerolineae bacterium]|nr:Gfo/Idh/MocA family oxidoreductase [Anaerolineae bacterium]
MLRMGLIGAGTMGRWYARTFAEYERSRLVAVCDMDRARAQALAEQWGAAAHTDYRAMLAEEQLDAVAVATPDRFHRAPAVACLEAGKHVLCEKPLATTMEDALAIEEAASRTGREVMVNFGNRRRDRVQAARRAVLEEGAIGEIADAYVELNERIGKTNTLSWAAETSPVWFLLSHCVDTLRYVTGLEIVEVRGYETRKLLAARGLPTSDTALFVAELSNGGHAFLGSSWAFPEAYGPDIDFRLRLLGVRGLLEVQMHPHDMWLHTGRSRTLNYTYGYLDHRGHMSHWWTDSTCYFVDCILDRVHPTPDLADGLACLRVLLAMEEAAATGRSCRVG